MVMIDQTGAINFVNSEAEKLFGYTREEFFDQTIEALLPQRFRAHHLDLRNGFFAKHESRSMGGGRDLYGVRKDGTEFPVEIGLNPVETKEGLWVLSAIVDITERKRLAAALQHSNDVLARSNLNLRQFAFIASHDLQTPLRTIGSFVQLLQMHYGSKLDARAEDWIRRSVNGVQKMRMLTAGLLSYAQIDARARPFLRTDLGEVVDDVVGFIDASIRDSGAEVSRGELPILSGDRSQLHQLLQNLIGNGIKFHGDQPPRVHVAAAKQGGEWLISVRDNGIGIDAKHHEKVFEMLKRLHTDRAYPGTGIGLAICQRVVEHHGGRIWVESERGKGSVFYFTIPENAGRDA